MLLAVLHLPKFLKRRYLNGFLFLLISFSNLFILLRFGKGSSYTLPLSNILFIFYKTIYFIKIAGLKFAKF